jgi:hypothetical protein
VSAGAALAALWAARDTFRRFYVSAWPDEWLLCIRDGRLVSAGVGVALVRRPGDVVVRFSSTMQRVSFDVDVLSRERVGVRIEGFIFWSVSSEGDAPFRAYSRLGIANLRQPPPGLKHPKHLLTSAQHKAFQQILTAVVQRHASALSLDALIGQQDALVRGLSSRLREVTEAMGVRIDQVEILAARPSDPKVQSQLATAETERLREAAETVRREVAERVTRADAESAARRAREALTEDESLALAREASEHEVKMRAEALARERAMAEEARAMEASRARRAREHEELEARLEGVRAEALAARDAEFARTEALERKSPAVREFERSVMVAERVAASVRVTDAKWVSVGRESPAESIGAMISGVREVLDAGRSAG